jgi:hypothetical protein
VRKTGPWFFGGLLLTVAYVLVRQTPFGAVDPVPGLLGALLGGVLAFRLFRDPGGTETFVFSLPLSRSRLFRSRWLLGLVLQAVTLACVAALLALGVREAAQVRLFDSLWYPMVRWYELSVLWSVGLCSLASYQIVAFLLLRKRLVETDQTKRRGRLRQLAGTAGFLVAAFTGLFGAWIVLLMTVRTGPGEPSLSALPTGPTTILSYVFVLTVLTTLAGLYCCRRLEVAA